MRTCTSQARAGPGPAAPVGAALRGDVRARLHERRADADRPAAGHARPEDQVAGRGRAGAPEPRPRHRDRRPAGPVRRPGLRQAQRPHGLPVRHAAPVDGRRPGGRRPRDRRRRHGTQRRSSCWSGGAWPRCRSTPCRPRSSPSCPTRCPMAQRGTVSGVLGITVPVAAVLGTFLVQLFAGHQVAMFLAPCAIGACLVAVLRRPSWTTDGSTRTPRGRGPCATWSPPSTWTRAAARTSPGRSRAVPLHQRLRVPDDLPGLLPHRPRRQRRGRGPEAGLPRHPRPVGRARRRLPRRRQVVGPHGTAEAVRRARRP